MAEPIPEIDVHTLAQMRGEGAVLTLLDVREPREVAVAAIEGCVTIPMRNVPERLSDIPREGPVVVLCHHGNRSAAVARFLMAQGFAEVYNLAGGIDAWARQIDPAMARY